jgi:hypothetical protein
MHDTLSGIRVCAAPGRVLATLPVALGGELEAMADVGLIVGRRLCEHPKLTRPHQFMLV